MKHLSLSTLIDYLKQTLSEGQHQEAEAHLKRCANCQQELDKAHQFLTNIQTEDMSAPEPNLIQRLATAFRKKQQRLSERPAFSANLQFDSWTNRAPVGLRGGIAQERQMLFSEGAYDIDVQLISDGPAQTFDLRGQILDVDPADDAPADRLEGLEVHIHDAQGDERRGLTDEYGRFLFSQLGRGSYSIRLLLDNHDVVFDAFDLEA